MEQVQSPSYVLDTQAEVDAQIAYSTAHPPANHTFDKAWQYFCTKLGKFIVTIIFILTGI